MQQELRRQSPSALSSTRPVALRMGLSATCVQNWTSRGERGVRVETEGLSATGTIGGANGGPQRPHRNHGVWIVRLTGQVGNLTMRLSDNTQYGWLRGQRPCIIARARSLRAARTLCIPTRISFDVRSPLHPSGHEGISVCFSRGETRRSARGYACRSIRCIHYLAPQFNSLDT